MRIPMRLQFFEAGGAAGGTGSAGSGSTGSGSAGGNAGGNSNSGGQGSNIQPPAIDYDRIQQMLEGTLAAKEDTALKAYFKQQGLSQQEAEQAIAAFKQQKAANQPDVGALQQQASQAQEVARQAQIQSAATMAAVELGINAKSIPYVLKMADFSQVVVQDGKINDDNLKAALNKVLEDVPALKPQVSGSAGFVQVGASSQGQQGSPSDEALKKAFGL